jgi:transcriptional regulator with AAA-type ATPase domain
MEKMLHTLLDKAVTTGFNVGFIGEAGVGKEWAARLLHRRSRTSIFHKYDFLTDEAERWSLTARFIADFDLSLRKINEISDTFFLKDIRYADRRQVAYLLDSLSRKLTVEKLQPAQLLHAGLVCSCDAALRAHSPWNEFITQFFPIEIEIPPLRERRADIQSLVAEFVSEWMRVDQKVISGIEAQALSLLENYNWPGNISELKSVLRQAFALTENFGTISTGPIERRILNRSKITARVAQDV